MEFDKKTFEAGFIKLMRKLMASEKVTKEALKELSRTVLFAWHATGNVEYANKVVAILSPMNKKTAIIFFKHFSGYSFDDKLMQFSGKSKKRYEQAHKDCIAFLEDPNNNIWSWAERNIEIEQKDFELASITTFMERAIKKADKAGHNQAAVLKAVFAAGVTPQALIVAFNAMDYKDGDGDAVEIPLAALGGEAAKQ